MHADYLVFKLDYTRVEKIKPFLFRKIKTATKQIKNAVRVGFEPTRSS